MNADVCVVQLCITVPFGSGDLACCCCLYVACAQCVVCNAPIQINWKHCPECLAERRFKSKGRWGCKLMIGIEGLTNIPAGVHIALSHTRLAFVCHQVPHTHTLSLSLSPSLPLSLPPSRYYNVVEKVHVSLQIHCSYPLYPHPSLQPPATHAAAQAPKPTHSTACRQSKAAHDTLPSRRAVQSSSCPRRTTAGPRRCLHPTPTVANGAG